MATMIKSFTILFLYLILSSITTFTTLTTRCCCHAFPNSHNIRAAMDASERFGIHSPEAKLAWETVEDFSSRDNTAAYERDENAGLSPEQLQQAYDELKNSIATLQRRQEWLQYNQQLMKDVAAELQAIKLLPPTRKPSPRIPGLWDAKLRARSISQQFGNTSPEAKLAWEEVEELASAGLETALGRYDNTYDSSTCNLVVAAEACMALEELDRFLYHESENGML